MNTLLRRSNTQDITYWEPDQANAFAGAQYKDPRVIRGHYEEMLVRVAVEGVEIESNAMACLAEEVVQGGLLLVGDHTGKPYPVQSRLRERARKILKIMKTPAIRKNLRRHEIMVYM